MHTMMEAKEVNTLARKVFLRDGRHVPIVILFKGDNNTVLPVAEFLNKAGGKDVLSCMIRSAIKMFGVSGVAMIMEAWTHTADNKDSSLVKQLEKGEIAVSDLSPEDRREVLMVNVESDDGLKVMFMNPIVRDYDGKPNLSEPEIIEQMAGRFVGFFPCSSAGLETESDEQK